MTEDSYAALRERMVDQQIKARGVVDSRVLAAMRKVPRHLFIPPHLWDQAYNDYPLPIGEDQTISQPYIVALMTETPGDQGDGPGPGDRHRLRLSGGHPGGAGRAVLEHRPGRCVWTEQARQVLDSLGFIKSGFGWETAPWAGPRRCPLTPSSSPPGAPKVPPAPDGTAGPGRTVGDSRWGTCGPKPSPCVRKTREGLKFEYHGGCRFVRLIGKYGWNGGREVEVGPD